MLEFFNSSAFVVAGARNNRASHRSAGGRLTSGKDTHLAVRCACRPKMRNREHPCVLWRNMHILAKRKTHPEITRFSTVRNMRFSNRKRMKTHEKNTRKNTVLSKKKCMFPERSPAARAHTAESRRMRTPAHLAHLDARCALVLPQGPRPVRCSKVSRALTRIFSRVLFLPASLSLCCFKKAFVTPFVTRKT